MFMFYFRSKLSNILLYYDLFYGTGSCPCPPQGLQESIRFIAKYEPLKGPCFVMAFIA